MIWLDDIINPMNMSLSKFWETLKDREDWCAAVQGAATIGHNWMTEQQQQQ